MRSKDLTWHASLPFAFMVDWTGIAAAIGPIATLAGSLGGYWLSGRNEEKRDKRQAARERDARHAALAEKLEEERHSVQRDTMLHLQDELLQLARVYGQVVEQDIKTLTQHGKVFQLPDNLGGEETRLLVASLQRLRSRILDADLRKATGDFIASAMRDASGLDALQPQDAIRELRRRDAEVDARYEELVERLGGHLRVELARKISVDELA
jgi:hypothetical protein